MTTTERPHGALVTPLNPQPLPQTAPKPPPAGRVGRRHAVFVSDFVHLERPFDLVATRLLDPEAAWLKIARRSASCQRFSLKAGRPRQNRSSVTVPMLWEPDGLASLPLVDADMGLSSLGDGHCRLSMNGRYSDPAAQVEVAAELLALHRAIEVALRRVLSDVAETLDTA